MLRALLSGATLRNDIYEHVVKEATAAEVTWKVGRNSIITVLGRKNIKEWRQEGDEYTLTEAGEALREFAPQLKGKSAKAVAAAQKAASERIAAAKAAAQRAIAAANEADDEDKAEVEEEEKAMAKAEEAAAAIEARAEAAAVAIGVATGETARSCVFRALLAGCASSSEVRAYVEALGRSGDRARDTLSREKDRGRAKAVPLWVQAKPATAKPATAKPAGAAPRPTAGGAAAAAASSAPPHSPLLQPSPPQPDPSSSGAAASSSTAVEPVVAEAEGFKLHLSSKNTTGYKYVKIGYKYRLQVSGKIAGFRAELKNNRNGGYSYVDLGAFDTAVKAAVAVARFLDKKGVKAEDGEPAVAEASWELAPEAAEVRGQPVVQARLRMDQARRQPASEQGEAAAGELAAAAVAAGEEEVEVEEAAGAAGAPSVRAASSSSDAPGAREQEGRTARRFVAYAAAAAAAPSAPPPTGLGPTDWRAGHTVLWRCESLELATLCVALHTRARGLPASMAASDAVCAPSWAASIVPCRPTRRLAPSAHSPTARP